ncbi:MAG: indole-3-glycerol-phosphate synthase [Deltaproteobacteria bacterium]|jgi:indole-3-glycerol phosphate synthase|nr:indole-3-glycerol-phosphate synthase [Deltaproteobacteria bacterium]
MGDLRAFKDAKAKEIGALKAKGEARLRKEIGDFAGTNGKRPDFAEALRRGREKRGIALVAEYKRASPSRGEIRSDLSPEDAAAAYREADAVSVLTEESRFGGSPDHLRAMAASSGLPVLRKDFVFHPLQVLETALTPASAVLLVVRAISSEKELASLVALAESLDLTPVVEVFGADELTAARSVGARVIQINARDLETFKVDFPASLKLIVSRPPRGNEIFVAASGISDAADMALARKAGFSAALVGTAIMESDDPGKKIRELLAPGNFL